jgi:hypothetical protein
MDRGSIRGCARPTSELPCLLQEPARLSNDSILRTPSRSTNGRRCWDQRTLAGKLALSGLMLTLVRPQNSSGTIL